MADSSSAKKKPKQQAPPKLVLPALLPQGNLGRDLANWLFPVYLGAILLGFWIIRSSVPGNIVGSRALFQAINAATLTGFQTGFPVDTLMMRGQLATMLLVVAGSLFSMIVGSLAMVRILKLSYSDVQIIISAFAAEAIAIILGTGLLWNSGRTLFDAALQATSAFGNCGVYSGPLPGLSQPVTHLVLFPLSILGGFGLLVLMELIDRIISRKPLSPHTLATIEMTASIYAIGFLLMLILTLASSGLSSFSDFKLSVAQSSAIVVESRTVGLPIIPVRLVPQVGHWLVIVLMVIGASSGGTGGGIKTTTLAELIRGVQNVLKGNPVSRAFGIALIWLASYAGIVLCAAMLLAYVIPEHGSDGILFNAVSAASNVGLSTTDIPDRANVYYAFSAIMLMGRMTPLMILWWMAESNVQSDLAIG
jgi:trk system potassium uptake protein TrkH